MSKTTTARSHENRVLNRSTVVRVYIDEKASEKESRSERERKFERTRKEEPTNAT